MDQPQHFGRFCLFRQDDANSYRTVYRAGLARGRTIERIIRLELFDQPGIEADQLLKRLEGSTGLQDKLRDPHIAPGAGVGQVDGTPYAAYDFELGITLSAFMSAAREQSFPVPFDQALFVGERIALALAAAYRRGHNGRPVLHSFLTPDSVLLSNEGEVKVSGFEVGYALRDQLAGSDFCAPYLSPKARAGQAPADHDDVFSLGSILFELVTGEPLSIESVDLERSVVQATGESIPENLRLLLAGSFAPPADRIPDVIAWQQNLGKVILDGEHNPTTFNLAFLIHTLLREPLERGAEHLAQEKRFLLPPRSEDEPTPETTALPPPPTTAAGTRDRAFWLGFSISGMTAGAIFLLLLTLGSGTDPAPANALAAPANVVLDLPGAEDPPALSVSAAGAAAAAAAAAEPQSGPWPAQPASLVLTEVVNGELGVPRAGEEPAPAAQSGAEFERLKAEYEQELDRLRKQISDNQRSESAAQEQPAPPATTLINRPAQTVNAAATQLEPLADPDQPEARPKPTTPALVESPELASPELASPEPASPKPAQPEAPEPAARAEAGAPVGPVGPVGSDIPVAGDQLAEPETASEGPLASSGPPPVTRTRAQLLRLAPPAYPIAARRLGLSATAHIKVLISPRGKVRQAEIVGPQLGSGFDAAALAAARRSRWEPATKDGEPVESWHAITIEFQP